MMEYFTLLFIILWYNFISVFTWDNLGRKAFDKIVTENKFGIKQFVIYIMIQIIITAFTFMCIIF
jgi:hypothetical protein